MRSLLFFIISLFSSISFAGQLHNYDQIKSAVTDGKVMRIYIDYTKCIASAQQLTLPNNAAVVTLNAMAINTEGDIGSYILYFTLNDPRYPGKPVYQHAKFSIKTNNTMVINFTVLNAADYAPLKGDDTLVCKLDEGTKIFVSGLMN